jgi:uncharacterized protein YfdQ (DUF2303 family)
LTEFHNAQPFPEGMEEGLAGFVTRIEALVGRTPATQPHPDGGQFTIVPQGARLVHLEPKPDDFIVAAPSFDFRQSFTDYVTDFKSANSRIFASISEMKIIAALDYHDKAGASGKMRHMPKLTLRHSPEWNAWWQINGRNQGQVDFAEFIEEHLDDILAPAGAQLLEMVENFTENRTVKFQSKTKRANGSITVSYQDEEDPTSTGNTKIPERLKLNLAVFEGEEPQEIEAFVRTSTQGGHLSILVKLHQVAQVKRKAFLRVCEEVGAATGITVAHGSI